MTYPSANESVTPEPTEARTNEARQLIVDLCANLLTEVETAAPSRVVAIAVGLDQALKFLRQLAEQQQKASVEERSASVN
jgi:hypothetical protein